MKKIGFISGDISRSGGTERVAALIANELNKKYEVFIISYGIEKKSYFNLNYNVKIINIFENKNIFLNKLTGVIKLRRIIKKYNLDIIIDVDTILSLNSIIASLGLKTKVISWEHFNFYNNMGVIRRDLGRKLAAKFAKNIITLTKEDKNYFEKNLKSKNIVQIYNPTPYENVIKTNCNSKIALAVGRLVKVKGFDKLLNIWSNIEKNESEWELHIVGTGEEKNNLLNLKEELGLKRLKFIEHTKDIEKHYQEASIYLMTSRFEGLPMTLIEAQSFGLPIISYDIKTGPRDIIINNKNGYLIENDNLDMFVENFLDLANNNEKRLNFSQNSYNDSKRFNTNSIVKRWEEVLNSNE